MSSARRILLFTVSAALVALPALPAAALPAAQPVSITALPGDVNDFTFRSFDAVYQLSRDDEQHAMLTTTETIVALFPQTDQNRGIIRAIPDQYGGVPLDTRVESVVDENGSAVPFTKEVSGGFVDLALGTDDYVHGPTTYVIRYSQRDTIRHFADTDDDEFYWDVNGTGWSQPFDEVSARVEVSSDLVPALNEHTACYQGAANSSTPCSSGVSDDGGVFTASARQLGVGENLTVAIGFASGTFVEGTPASDADQPALPSPSAWSVVLAVLGWGSVVPGIVGFARARRVVARPTGTIIAQYDAPRELNIMAAAPLINRKSSALQAQLVSLAVRKKIRLLGYATQPEPSARMDRADYSLQLLDPTGIDALERPVIDAIFGPQERIGDSHDLKRHGDPELAAKLQPIVATVDGYVDGAGFFQGRRPTTGGIVAFALVVVLVFVGIIGAAFGGWVGVILGGVGLLPALLGLGFGIVGLVGAKRPSPMGAQWIDYLLGMKMYMELAEAERFRVLQSVTGAQRVDTNDGRQVVELYEKLLPWAVLWGIEDSWARELQLKVEQTGTELAWYVGPQPFSSTVFTPLLGGIGTGLAAPASSWGGSGFSSFGGGSFGGGFSGGGGGGGGGGGR